jgi:DNA-binding transcriptional LysR family regulator
VLCPSTQRLTVLACITPRSNSLAALLRRRLECDWGLLLLERTTHHVELTPAGRPFLIEARQILAHLDRAAATAHRAARAAPTLRVGVVDAIYESMGQILSAVQDDAPGLEIH